MKKVTQTKFHNPPKSLGNCFAAALACFLEWSIEEIPAFEELMFIEGENGLEENPEWAYSCMSFLRATGWERGVLEDHLDTDECYLAIGPSPRGHNHCCIYQKGELWHDPYPNGSGLTSIIQLESLRKC